MQHLPEGRLGATVLADGGVRFNVWAPRVERVEVVLEDRAPVALTRDEHGYHAGRVEDAGPGTRYRYRLHQPDGSSVDRADPASRHQPQGLHGPSAVDDPEAFTWHDAGWSIGPMRDQVLYELHVGSFTPEGTFEAIIPRLAQLRDLGVTALELMPVWQFPGGRNWGYDGVLPFAVQDTYGGPEGLRRLVDAAHQAGLGVLLDVVYNHYGPEGNHLADFGPYFTDRYDTPWGDAVNVDDAGSDHVRRFIVENAVRWIEDLHLDGLRLDAVHAVLDRSAVHWLEELSSAVHAAADRQSRRALVIAESDLQDPRLVRSPDRGGYGLDAQWLDDVHHTVRVAVTGDRSGYYADHEGIGDLVRAVRDRYVLAGRYSSYRGHTVGRPAPDVPHERFVVCTQNHDQVGNRMLGERLDALVDPPRARLAAATILLSPFTPMLFMGEEHAETAPFLYFVSHTDDELVAAVRTGRREEFSAFAWQGDAPDPQAVETFERSRVDWTLRDHGVHADRLAYYRELLRLRREHPAITGGRNGDVQAHEPQDGVVVLTGRDGQAAAWTVLNATEAVAEVTLADAPADVAVAFGSEEGVALRHDDARPGAVTVTVPPWGATVLLTLTEEPV